MTTLADRWDRFLLWVARRIVSRFGIDRGAR